MKRRILLLAGICLLLSAGAGRVLEIGFSGMEMYKFDRNIEKLHLADMNGDGRTDILVVNNRKAEIVVLLNKGENRKDPEVDEKQVIDNINVINYDSRFSVKKIPVTARIDSIQVADMNGDGKRDIVFLGSPGGLFLFIQKKDGVFEKERNVEIPEAVSSPHALRCALLRRGGVPAVFVLCKQALRVFDISRDPNLAHPRKIPLDESLVKTLADFFVEDFDGDGRKDLVFAAPFSKRSLWVMVQEDEGKFGGIHSFDLGRYTSLRLHDADGDGKPEIFYLEKISGRVGVSAFRPAGGTDGKRVFGDIVFYPYPSSESRERDMAVGDVTGDGLPDVVVTEPSISALSLFARRKERAFSPFRIYPSLINAKKVCIGDFLPAAGAEILVFSKKENMIGLSRFIPGKGVSFPEPLPLQGKISAAAAADVDGDGRCDVLYAAEVKEKGKKKRVIRVLKGERGGLTGSGLEVAPAAAFKTGPSDIIVFDADGDGKKDVIVFVPYEKHFRIFLQKEKGFEEISHRKEFNGGMIEHVSVRNFSTGDVDGDGRTEFIITRRNFARILTLEKGRIKILEQINSPLNGSVASMVPVSLSGKAKDAFLLFDAGFNKIFLMRKTRAGYEPVETMDTECIAVERIYTADFSGTGKEEVILKGRRKFGVIPRRVQGEKKDRLVRLASYETKIKDGKYGYLRVGSFKGKGSTQIILLEAVHHIIEFLSMAKGVISPVVNFKVFEAGPQPRMSMFGEKKEGKFEPREMAFKDVNGDSLTDLVVIVHDRIIVYLQEK